MYYVYILHYWIRQNFHEKTNYFCYKAMMADYEIDDDPKPISWRVIGVVALIVWVGAWYLARR